MFANYADVAALAVGLVLPVVVALFTKPSTNSNIKAAAHGVLATATGLYAVYQAHPSHMYWAPAVVAAFLAWISGTAVYQSVLKKQPWFPGLASTLVKDAASVLHVNTDTLKATVDRGEQVVSKDVARGMELIAAAKKALEDARGGTLPSAPDGSVGLVTAPETPKAE